MPHLDAGQIHELLDGEISSSELPPIQAHLASCPACRARLDEERTLVAGTDELVALLELPGQRDTTPPIAANPPLRGQWVRDLAWAATVVIAIGLGYAARGTPSLRVVHDTVTVAPPANMTQVAPAAPVITHDLPAKTRAKVVPAAAPTPPAPQPLNAANGAAAAPERRADLAAAKSATAVDSAATPPRTGTLATADQMRVAAAAPPTGNRGGGAGRGGGHGGHGPRFASSRSTRSRSPKRSAGLVGRSA